MYTDEFAEEIEKYYGKTEADFPAAARGIAALLQKDASNYYFFGAYWWAVKKLLIKYSGLDEWFTGDYMDDLTYERAWHGTELRTISAAAYYQDQQIMKTPCHSVIIDGVELSYTLFDANAGF